MHNFGKMTLEKVPIKDHPLYSHIGLYYDTDNILWHDLFKKYSYAIYAMVEDNGWICSWQEDPEQSQVDGIDIWGFTKKEAKKRGKHTHFDGKKFYTPTPKKESSYLDIIKELQERIEILEKR